MLQTPETTPGQHGFLGGGPGGGNGNQYQKGTQQQSDQAHGERWMIRSRMADAARCVTPGSPRDSLSL